MLTVRGNFFRPSHNSPSSASWGRPATNQSGAWKRFPWPRQELLAVPVSANAVELLAQPPAGRVGRQVPTLGQQEFRGLVMTFFRNWFCRQSSANSRFLGGVTAQFAKVLAGATFDADRLITPSRTGTGIDATGVLENIGPASGTLHFVRFPSFKSGITASLIRIPARFSTVRW